MRAKKTVDLTRARATGPEVNKLINQLFEYQKWDDKQVQVGLVVRIALQDAYQLIIEVVPPCPLRTRALNHIYDARMLANAAITHKGDF